MPTPNEYIPSSKDYSIGWICAITIESLAASIFLDGQYREPADLAAHRDSNNYTYGEL